mgnify:CR=1 FL=1
MRKGRGRPVEKSLGLIEVLGLSCAVEVADAMVKAANVVLDELETARGSGMMTVKVRGDVGAVRAAVEAGKATALSYGALVSADVIARPHEGTGACFIHRQGKKERPDFYAACPEVLEAETLESDGAEAGAPGSDPVPEKPRRTRRPRTAGKARKRVAPVTDVPPADTPAADTAGPETSSGHSSE